MVVKYFQICRRFSVIVVACAFFLVSAAYALVCPIPLEELVHQSDLIIIGRVKCLDSGWNEDKRIILTRAEIELLLILKGEHAKSTPVTVVYRGGNVNGIEMRFSEAVTLSEGERVLLFLRRCDNGQYRIYGWLQGKYTIESGANGDLVAKNPLCPEWPDLDIGLDRKEISLDRFLAMIRQAI